MCKSAAISIILSIIIIITTNVNIGLVLPGSALAWVEEPVGLLPVDQVALWELFAPGHLSLYWTACSEQGTHFMCLLNKSGWYLPPWAADRQVRYSPTSGSPPPINMTILPQWICFAITLKTKICSREPYFAVKRHLRSVASLVDAPGMVLLWSFFMFLFYTITGHLTPLWQCQSPSCWPCTSPWCPRHRSSQSTSCRSRRASCPRWRSREWRRCAATSSGPRASRRPSQPWHFKTF